MAKTSAIEIAKVLGDKIHGINLMTPDWLARGTSADEAQLLSLRKSIALLVEALATKKSYKEIMKAYEELAGAIDTAGITGLISETELTEYYALVDKLWAAIEKEK